ncbi:hypothetical protein O8C83_04775 [Aliarcobacter butzleri]|uniref:hypothetical protein n=1 Tax=Aliarcobacter butzleri TaxID=28197 RepID=UPI00263C1EF7|nr:hypothetical protein [Aliarcobacter butzleri]MDN5100125.1 hypothetical protein [Aliarcobacter butzleri]
MNNNSENICRVCGLQYDINYVRDEFGEATFNICDCCGVEFGYEDINIKSIIKYRYYWLNELKGKWFIQKNKPKEWDINKQLENIPRLYAIDK